ncbi:MAG: hypothetical protein DRH08_12365, partial [Deltaproteobacteria bacterium]
MGTLDKGAVQRSDSGSNRRDKGAVEANAAGGGVTVSAADISQSQTIDNVTLTQSNALAVDDISQSNTID